jgi:putative heme-binding domain-containing protein
MTVGRVAFLLAAGCAAASGQAHSYTQAEVEEGKRRYRTSCIGCHGSEGASVSGIDLGRGRFRRVTSDEDLVKVILEGVPGTGMPATPLSPSRAWAVVAYLRSMSDPGGRRSVAAARGDEARGKALFRGKAGCGACHRIGSEGGRTGPDLSDAGVMLRAIEIETAMLDPDAEYTLTSRPYRVVLRDGTEVAGMLLNQDSYSVQMRDGAGNLRSFARAELRESGEARSAMPSYRGKLDAQELADLVAYVSAQRGVQ